MAGFGHGELIVEFQRGHPVGGRCLLPRLVLPFRLRVIAGVLVDKGQPRGDFIRLEAKPFPATEALEIGKNAECLGLERTLTFLLLKTGT